MTMQNKRKGTVETKYRHSDKCKYGEGKSGRYTYIVGQCPACDDLKSRSVVGVYEMPDSYFGLNIKEGKKIYCYNTRSQAERCTKYTNPKCACGKVIFYQEERPNTGQKEFFSCATYNNLRF